MRMLALVTWVLACAGPGLGHAQSVQTFRYDEDGRLVAVTTANPGSGRFSSYTLDNADNRTARNDFPIGYPVTPYRLASGEQLVPGQQLTSQDGRFALKVQQDGNVVLWFGEAPLWSTGTATGQSLYFRLQASGVAGLFDVSQNLLWASSPSAGGGSTLTLQDDGDLVLKTSGGVMVWHSNTCCH